MSICNTKSAGQRLKSIYVLPSNNHSGFLPWVGYAAVHDMQINMGYFARADEK